MKDQEIIALFWQRSETAIAESQRKYGGYCTAVAYRILRSREDAEEFQALRQLPEYLALGSSQTIGGLPVPIHRYPRARVDEILQQYAGITTAGLSSTEGVFYLREYDAWYNFTSDFGLGTFLCSEGELMGEDTVMLRSESHYTLDGPGGPAQLTLVKSGEDWHIRSLLPLPDGTDIDTEAVAE